MRALLVGLACVLAAAAPIEDKIDNLVTPPTIQVPNGDANITKYVKHAHRASLNFACAVERITVTPNFEQYSAGFEDPISQIELEDHIGEPINIEWAHTMQSFFASTDPRGQERQLGTLGGDLGEFLIILASIEAETQEKFTPSQVLHKLKTYLTVMSKDKFYFDTDMSAINTLKGACHCPQLNIADPPDSKKAILRNATHLAGAQGNEFFKKVLEDPGKFLLRKELVDAVLDSFFEVMWVKSDPLHRRIRFVLMKGELNAKGFVMVKTPGYCNAQLLAPLISPELCQKQMSVYHGDAAVLLRTELAGVFLMKNPENKNAVVKRANELAATALTNVLADHLEPVYTVSFEGIA
jgi:hypothetical protein